MKKLLSAAVLALSVAACQQGGMSPYQQAYGTNFPGPKDGMAAVYLVRAAAPPDAPPIPISEGRQAVGSLTGSSWIRLDALPNPLDLRAYGSQDSTELIITVAAGETYFLIAEPAGATNAKLMTISWDEGRRLVRQGQQVPSNYYPANNN
jgi:hypothetical protein